MKSKAGKIGVISYPRLVIAGHSSSTAQFFQILVNLTLSTPGRLNLTPSVASKLRSQMSFITALYALIISALLDFFTYLSLSVIVVQSCLNILMLMINLPITFFMVRSRPSFYSQNSPIFQFLGIISNSQGIPHRISTIPWYWPILNQSTLSTVRISYKINKLTMCPLTLSYLN